MNCHATRAVLDLHAEGRLTPGRAKSVAEHLKSCADCRKFAVVPDAPSVLSAGKDFKARLAASLKAQRTETPAAAHAPHIQLWPRDLTGVALASAALILVSAIIGWSGVPSQRDMSGDDLASWRTP